MMEHGVTEVVRSSGVHADSSDGDDDDSVVQVVILDWGGYCGHGERKLLL